MNLEVVVFSAAADAERRLQHRVRGAVRRHRPIRQLAQRRPRGAHDHWLGKGICKISTNFKNLAIV